MRKAFTLLSALYALAVCLAADLPKIEVVGKKFFYANNGSQFYVRGIAYQQDTTNSTAAGVTDYVDPLADGDACSRDVKYLAQANTNVLRVYAVDPTLNHDSCMKTFAEAGIYIIADLSEPKTSINRDSPEWNLDLYNRYTSVVDMFSNYTNVLGFFAGNEVTNNASNTDASAFVKAAVRDMKAYIKQKGWSFPVGYSSNDDADTRVAIADYFACGNLDERADFFGINMYEWCGDSTFQESGYKDRTADFQNLTVPIFFSEYGCNEVRPRKFTEVQALYGDEMTDVWSGGIVYMYFEETNKYGLVSVNRSSVSTLADYSYYSQEINSISPSSATKGLAQTQTLACPASGATWNASPILPPTPNQSVCDCVYGSLKCVVNDKVEVKNYGALYKYICGKIDCSAVSGNGTTGKYGVVSFCSDKEKLSYMLNAYYENENKASSACSFQGSATLQSKVTVASSCSSAVSSVSKYATASSSPTSSSESSESSNNSSGSSSSSSQAAKSSRAAGNVVARAVSKAELVAIGAMVMCVVGGFTTFFA